MTMTAELTKAAARGHMVTDDLGGFPIEFELRFRAQVFSPLYGWVHMWSGGGAGKSGEWKSNDAAALEKVCREHTEVTGQRTRIIEFVPTAYLVIEP
jgi:hypothetical protein